MPLGQRRLCGKADLGMSGDIRSINNPVDPWEDVWVANLCSPGGVNSDPTLYRYHHTCRNG